tara:strand:- start:18580 stop:19149 length:570 start_codon:yes stop_codon:yes gene_type:complete
MAEKQQKKYYFEQKPGYRLSTGIKLEKGADKGRTTDWVMVTDNAQGLGFYKDGLSRLTTNKTSLDLSGFKCKENEPAKIIKAENGDIYIEAVFGDLHLKGRNITIEATADDGECVITSGKHVEIRAAICKINGEMTSVLASKDLKLSGQFVQSTAGITNELTQMTDLYKASFYGKLMGGLNAVKQFLDF